MESLILKKAIFYPTKIVLIRKKGNITIPIDEISSMIYNKPSILEFFLIGYNSKLTITLDEEIHGKKEYVLNIKPKNIYMLQDAFKYKIIIP